LRGERPAVQLAAPELVLRESVRRAIR